MRIRIEITVETDEPSTPTVDKALRAYAQSLARDAARRLRASRVVPPSN